MTIDLRLGRWQDVLADVDSVDAIVCDPPYSARTHASDPARGYDGGTAKWPDDGGVGGLAPSYDGWRPEDVFAFVRAWERRCRGWIVALTSHDLIPSWETIYRDETDRYCFAPIPCVMRGMSVRLAGDGPSSWTVYAIVSRPRTKEFSTWGTLDGAYVGPRGNEAGGGRGKPTWLMQAIVRDYSRVGDLVCDPFAGWGGTLHAAESLGRRAIGSEVDTEAFAEAQRRISRSQQMDLFT